MARPTCPLCGDTADDVSTRDIRAGDLDEESAPDWVDLSDVEGADTAFTVKEYEHGQSTSDFDGGGMLGPIVKVERRCTLAVPVLTAMRDGDLPNPLAPELADHRTKQAEPDAPSAGCGTYPFVGDERRVEVDLDAMEVTRRPGDDDIINWVDG